jgi:hypothetical protein
VERAVELLRPRSGRPLEECDVQALVDATYESVATQWQNEVRSQIGRALDSVVRANHPLSSHPELEAAFEDLFDGCEVVPGTFEAEYRRRLEEEPLAASLLRVPISTGQRHKLRRAGRLHGEIAHVPYGPLRGLDLTFRDDDA